MMCGDCAWGIEEDESRDNLLQQSQQSRVQKIRKIASKGIQKAKNLFKRKKFQTQGTQTADSTTVEQISVHSQYFEENMDRLVKHGSDRYNLFHYEKMANSVANEGFSTPTELVTYPDGDPKIWSDISEIRYANDVSYDKLENPKMILYRNKDNSCYIILRIEGNKHGVFYGTNESHIKVGGKSFSVYEVSNDVGSFTDDIPRLIYVDESGLYFVTAEENPVEDVIDTYRGESKFNFKGSVIKVSAFDGSITLDGEPITKDNFFDNWVLEEREVERRGKERKTVLSTKQPKLEEIIRNFYPPKGSYGDMYSRIRGVDKIQLNVFTEIPEKNSSGYQLNLTDRKWMDYFVRMHILTEKSKSKEGCEEVVRNGMFSSFLSNFSSHFRSFSGFSSDIVRAINRQISAKGISDEFIPANRVFFSVLLRDPEFVRGLKKEFASIEAGWKPVKESEMWIPFEIVRNL